MESTSGNLMRQISSLAEGISGQEFESLLTGSSLSHDEQQEVRERHRQFLDRYNRLRKDCRAYVGSARPGIRRDLVRFGSLLKDSGARQDELFRQHDLVLADVGQLRCYDRRLRKTLWDIAVQAKHPGEIPAFRGSEPSEKKWPKYELFVRSESLAADYEELVRSVYDNTCRKSIDVAIEEMKKGKATLASLVSALDAGVQLLTFAGKILKLVV